MKSFFASAAFLLVSLGSLAQDFHILLSIQATNRESTINYEGRVAATNLTLLPNEKCEVLSYLHSGDFGPGRQDVNLNWLTSRPGLYAGYGPPDALFWLSLNRGDTILGPAIIELRGQPNFLAQNRYSGSPGFAMTTLRIQTVNTSPAQAAVQPAGFRARVELEGSTDLKTWNVTQPREFDATSANHFFRVRLTFPKDLPGQPTISTASTPSAPSRVTVPLVSSSIEPKEAAVAQITIERSR